MSIPRRQHLSIALLLLFWFNTHAAAQFEQILSVDNPRPIDRFTRIVETHCQCVITYEDPEYGATQVVDITSKIRRDGKAEPRVWGPRPSFFSYTYESSPAAQTRDEVGRSLGSAIKQFNSARKDGVAFQVVETPTAFHVVPARGSILTTMVPVKIKEGPASDVIRAILAEVSAARGKTIDLSGISGPARIRVDVDRGYADQLLLSILQSIDNRLSWKLKYDYGLQFYVFNVVNNSKPPVQVIE